jgi:hypothetical protein
MDTVKFAPLRSLDDFILTTSRFQVPDLQNREKYYNRLVANLLYYQTNYFLTSIIIFTSVIIVHPLQMALGIITIGVLFGKLYYFQSQNKEVKTLKEKHPKNVFGVIGICACAICSGLGSVMVVIIGVGLPVCFSILHASLRLRNIKNKLVNATESLGIAKITPMSLILNEINVDSEMKTL